MRLSDVFENGTALFDAVVDQVSKRSCPSAATVLPPWLSRLDADQEYFVSATRVRARGDAKARRLNDPLDGPGNQHPPGEAAGNAPHPRGTNGHLVAVHFVSHVGTPFSKHRDSASAAKQSFPLAGIGVPEGRAGETP